MCNVLGNFIAGFVRIWEYHVFFRTLTTSTTLLAADVLNFSHAAEAIGFPDKLSRGETTTLAFPDRARGILTKKMTSEFRETCEALARPVRAQAKLSDSPSRA